MVLQVAYQKNKRKTNDERIQGIIEKIFKRKFPREINKIYLLYEYTNENSKYCTDKWKQVKSWDKGSIVPMIRQDNELAFYEITDTYYENGNSMSDWAFGDDGKYRNFKFKFSKKCK